MCDVRARPCVFCLRERVLRVLQSVTPVNPSACESRPRRRCLSARPMLDAAEPSRLTEAWARRRAGHVGRDHREVDVEPRGRQNVGTWPHAGWGFGTLASLAGWLIGRFRIATWPFPLPPE
eukprot:6347187-Prymnesium_polylepis.2